MGKWEENIKFSN